MVWADSSSYAHNYSSAGPAFLWFHIVTHLKHSENTTLKTGSEYLYINQRILFSKDYVWNHRECHKFPGSLCYCSKILSCSPQVLKNTITSTTCRLCWVLSPCSVSVVSPHCCSLGAAPGQPCSRWGLAGAQGSTSRSSRDLFHEPGTG